VVTGCRGGGDRWRSNESGDENLSNIAEEKGFEPLVAFRPRRFSKVPRGACTAVHPAEPRRNSPLGRPSRLHPAGPNGTETKFETKPRDQMVREGYSLFLPFDLAAFGLEGLNCRPARCCQPLSPIFFATWVCRCRSAWCRAWGCWGGRAGGLRRLVSPWALTGVVRSADCTHHLFWVVVRV